jgi:hypothetical protein
MGANTNHYVPLQLQPWHQGDLPLHKQVSLKKKLFDFFLSQGFVFGFSFRLVLVT